MIPSVRSSHAPPLPLTIPPMLDAPAAMSWPSSIWSALAHTTIIGTPAELWVRVPDPRGNKVFDNAVFVAGNGSAEGSV